VINRNIYLNPFEEKDFPFQCPYCDKGVLEVVEDTFQTKSTEASISLMDQIGEVSCLDTKFIAFLKCGNKNCKESVVVTGKRRAEDWSVVGDGETLIFETYSVKYTDPQINIIKILDGVPKTINNALRKSFSLFWSHPSSAGNEIRKVIEFIMDEKKVQTTGVNKKGKKYPLSLHERIEKFGEIEKEKYCGESFKLLSIKWLGNAGSHKGELIEKEDILDAYDVLDHVLDEIFLREKRIAEIKISATKVDKKFNPKGKK
jgi:hypothetical protein